MKHRNLGIDGFDQVLTNLNPSPPSRDLSPHPSRKWWRRPCFCPNRFHKVTLYLYDRGYTHGSYPLLNVAPLPTEYVQSIGSAVPRTAPVLTM